MLISVGQAYFTAKREEDKVRALEHQQKLSKENMLAANWHFSRVKSEKKARAKEEEVDQMPPAIPHFTLKDSALYSFPVMAPHVASIFRSP